jgi:hypothetical protein
MLCALKRSKSNFLPLRTKGSICPLDFCTFPERVYLERANAVQSAHFGGALNRSNFAVTGFTVKSAKVEVPFGAMGI